MSKINKWILVTGGSRGIGRALVERFCHDGFEVVFTYKKSAELAQQLVQLMTDAGKVATAFACDGTIEQEVMQLSKTLIAQKGPPFAVINNAGITRDALFVRMETSDWTDVIEGNLYSTFFVTKHFLMSMQEAGEGSVVQISSVAGLKGNPGQVNYSATKAALTGMTRSLALEVARFGIRVNAIAPGYIETEMSAVIPESQRKSIRNQVPLRRLGTSMEVAALASFLVSTESSYITGQTLVIDGGLTA